MFLQRIRCVYFLVVVGLFVRIEGHALELASPFSEHMILQREMPVPVWGWGKSGENVEVSIAGISSTTEVGKDGRWKMTLAELPAGGPYVFQAKSGSSVIEYSDVLVGEVWICSGQSNMQMGYNQLKDSEALLKVAKKQPIRSLEVKRNVRFTPQEKFSGHWVVEPCKSAVGFMFALELQQALGVPVGIIEASWGSSSLEGWLPLSMTEQLPHFRREMKAFEKFDRAETERLIEKDIRGETREREDDIYMRTRPNILYNAMLYPVAPYAARGLVWYQGEANSGTLAHMRQYGETLPLWCKHLRELWGRDEFHFLAVMLPRYGRVAAGSPSESATAPNAYSWAWFREAQQQLLTLPHTGIANTIDLGDKKNIHPKDKEPIGKRLALLAQKQIPGSKVIASGPVLHTFSKTGDNSLRITFLNAEGLHTTDGKSPREFWVAGPDLIWLHARADLEDESVVLRWEGKLNPVAVRYAFSAFPNVNLVNGAGLPAMPFRTDTDRPPGYDDEPSLVADKHRRK
ncbi:MAG: sialate O-acetylesterase [Verrucomicrobia bacterium]|nr:sialate O-acetylesterase [Verrucomicrobiota bacterium]MDA1068983.1 sialate O-acetylesterase [Verrucomicrobiota bacterium]